ncbi:RNA polymerase [Enterobacter phage phiEap-1]|uniref:DNA-directed RNA polymerase n=1 Tax=Enterobacter phage phiEap-1 TaxID=1587520 RepID=A0A0K2FHD8_9CAUD|nr:RNA polymerase [Enterobacter phage phiEap-1]ALA45066.1 DNA-directed RNA polymerase [Enterobacter phage phiEap-1]
MSLMNSIERNDFSDIELAAIPYNILSEHYGASLAKEQLALEHEAYELGEQRFLKTFERQMNNGELADNAAAKPLVLTLLPRLVSRINQWRHEQVYKLNDKGEEVLRGGKKTIMFNLTATLTAEAVALATIKTVLASLTSTNAVTIQEAGSAIGRAIEDEARFGRIRDLEEKHFKKNVKEQLEKRVGTVYKKAFMQVIEADMLSKGLMGGQAWASWSKEDSIHVGIRCIELLIEATGMVEVVRHGAGIAKLDSENLQLTKEYADLITKRAGALAGISPMFQPCVVPPKPWTEITGGGYWANGRRPLALVRTHGKKALMRYQDVYMPEVYKAINIAQSTPWKINQKVLKVANEIVNWKNCPVEDVPATERKELPVKPDDIDTNPEALKAWKKAASTIYRNDKARVSRRISMEFMLAQANKFANKKAIWFPYNMDWRGRVYAVPMFNPQGNDLTKGLLTLAKGKPIGLDGLYWLKIHGANCAGVDKVPFPERIKFIEENHDNIMQSAANPIEFDWWAKQDSPFCFLAFCFEYAGVEHHGLNYNCSLPLAFDGSCSGIQHFSAMLRDEIGGRAVNLLPSTEVQDIYRIVADKVNEILKVDAVNGTANEVELITDKTTGEIKERLKVGTSVMAQEWLAFGVTRKVTKRSVMTLAYGSKEFGFRQQILDDTVQPAIDNGYTGFTNGNQSAGYMAKLIWNAVSVTVVAAVEAMNWLKSAAKLLAAEVKDKKTKEVLRARCAVHWVTPDGFPVWQEYRKSKQVRLDLIFLGSIRLQPTVNTNKDTGIDAHKQESGIAPNFVHSQDGNHLRATVVHAHEKYGIESFALIHDSFGTIPADAANLFKAVRETMVETYESNDVLADFYEQFADQLHESQLEDMPALPKAGNLNLQDILKSDFAFA